MEASPCGLGSAQISQANISTKLWLQAKPKLWLQSQTSSSSSSLPQGSGGKNFIWKNFYPAVYCIECIPLLPKGMNWSKDKVLPLPSTSSRPILSSNLWGRNYLSTLHRKEFLPWVPQEQDASWQQLWPSSKWTPESTLLSHSWLLRNAAEERTRGGATRWMEQLSQVECTPSIESVNLWSLKSLALKPFLHLCK